MLTKDDGGELDPLEGDEVEIGERPSPENAPGRDTFVQFSD
jgi:hypothetical protein